MKTEKYEVSNELTSRIYDSEGDFHECLKIQTREMSNYTNKDSFTLRGRCHIRKPPNMND